MPWGQLTISHRAEWDIARPAYHGTISGAGYQVAFAGEATPEETVRRIVAQVIVFAMPPEGLDETVSTLVDIYEFNRDRPQPQTASLLAAPMTGRVVQAEDRGPLTVE